jgi:recombination protein RecA
MKIGVMFGSPETTTGGNALKFYSSVRMDIRRVESIMKGENAIGNRVRVKVVKNKVAPPFRKAEFDIYFDEGFSREANVLDEAVKLKLVKKSGTWYSMDDNKMGQGKDNARIYLLENPEVTDMLEVQILRFYGITIPDNLTEVAKKVKPLEGLALPDLADTESGDEPGTDKVEDQENSG